MSPATAQDIQAANRLFEQEVVAKRNYDALDKIYTADARILPPGGAMMSGRENIKAFWKKVVEEVWSNVTSVTLETLHFEPAGEGGWEIGRATLQFAGDAPAASAKYVVVWKKEDARWKWHVDIWNMNP